MTALEQRFVWRGRLPVGHISVIAGSPAAGKSTLGYHIAGDADVPTIFVTTEEADRAVWRPRIEASGMDLEKAWHHGEVQFSRRPEDLSYLAELVERYEAKLVIVDPVRNHLRASLSHEQSVREVFEPYLDYVQDADVALLLQMHVLRDVNAKRHPLAAIPSGVTAIAKAIYLFADDPTIGSDPNVRILACADKFNFGEVPRSLEFEYATRPVSVCDELTGRRQLRDYGYWILRGESKIRATALLLSLTPETKGARRTRAAWRAYGAAGAQSHPSRSSASTSEVFNRRSLMRTVERVAEEMGIVKTNGTTDQRQKFWSCRRRCSRPWRR
jgi:adenosyl cobinamide kinase/adenosyl cobinamide phosphate guanylyltransferase